MTIYFTFFLMFHVISKSLSPWHGASSGCGGRNSLK